ncbi:MAG: cytochrome b/b6 domain-containing protein [Burkholderiaceae bacterium]|jgi:cytochrome b|nr:cytochrome b/b6 domain-containing protein [Burkholderiaceae bacterium]
MKKILVWDAPVRIGHWLMAGGFALAWLTGEREAWRLVHVLAGGTVTAAALFRLVWGVAGSRHARFASFMRGPRQAFGYLKSLLRSAPTHYAGHNPAGAWAVVLLLLLALLSGASGWLTYQEIGGGWLEKAHEACTSAMLAVAAAHVLGVLASSLAHRENLVTAMFTGRKLGHSSEAISSPHWLAAAVLLIWTAAGAWWLAR